MNADEIGRILDELGERLGPTGSHVFELAVRQVVIESTIRLILTAGLFILCAAFLVASVVQMRRDINQEGPWFTAIVTTSIGMIAALVASSAIVPLLNPEYKALMDLIGAIR